MRYHVTLAVCLTCGWASAAFPGERLVVHEWGTFTSFQNEAGEALRRINTDDEPVPEFVHQLVNQPRQVKLFPPTELALDQPDNGSQAAPPADHRVTMRLETPVIYFHLPASRPSMTLDVAVDFRRGFLTQFFPNAEATVNGQPVDKAAFPHGSAEFSSLRWTDVRVGESGPMPDTTDHVWLAPRAVAAAPITVGSESERFLFYRGVGDLDSPLRVVRHADQILEVRINPAALRQLDELPVPVREIKWSDDEHPATIARHVWNRLAAPQQPMWLLEVRPDGRSAFRQLQPTSRDHADPQSLRLTSGTFAETEFSPDNLARLKTEMQTALVAAGLHADEAAGLLNTWELSYFLSPGQRLFYLAPREWTDAVLPLSLSVPADVIRVMVGRIELVTPRQRDLIRQMAATPVPDLTALLAQMKTLRQNPAQRDAYNALASGRGDSSVLGVSVPPIYQTFLDLGRFRTSLLLDALRRDRQSGTNRLDRVMQFQFELLFPGRMQRD